MMFCFTSHYNQKCWSCCSVMCPGEVVAESATRAVRGWRRQGGSANARQRFAAAPQEQDCLFVVVEACLSTAFTHQVSTLR